MTQFARVRPLDLIVVACAVVGALAAAEAYRSLSRAHTTIVAITPAIVNTNEPTRVRLTASHLVPFLQAYLVKTGTRFALNDLQTPETGLFFVSSTEAELDCPALAPGSYDVYLYKDGRQMAVQLAAIRAEPRPLERGVIATTIRVFVPDEIVRMLHEGDRARGDAVVQQVHVRPGFTETWDLHRREARYFGVAVPNRAVDLTVSIPVGRSGGGPWQYQDAPVRAGEFLTLSTDRYVLHGLALDVERVTSVREQGARTAP